MRDSAGMRSVAVALISCLLTNGCATYYVWSSEKTVQKDEQITYTVSDYVLNEKHHRLCIGLDRREATGDRASCSVGSEISKDDLAALNGYFNNPGLLRVTAKSGRYERPGPSADAPAKCSIDLHLQFEVPNDPVVVERTGGERYRRPAGAPEAPDNAVVGLIARKAAQSGGAVRGMEPAGWLDREGRVIGSAEAITTCRLAIEQEFQVLMKASGEGDPVFVRVPSAVLCKYNRDSLEPSSMLKGAELMQNGNGRYRVRMPVECTDHSLCVLGHAHCDGKHTTPLSLGITAPAEIQFERTVNTKEPEWPLAGRIAATPFTVAFDVVTSPVQIVVGAVMVVWTVVAALYISNAMSGK